MFTFSLPASCCFLKVFRHSRCSWLAILSQRSFHTLESNFFASYFLIIVVNVSLFLTGMYGSEGIGRWSSRGILTAVDAGPSVPQWKYTGMCTRAGGEAAEFNKTNFFTRKQVAGSRGKLLTPCSIAG